MHILQHKQSANAEDFTEVLIEFLGMELNLAMWGRGISICLDAFCWKIRVSN